VPVEHWRPDTTATGPPPVRVPLYGAIGRKTGRATRKRR
jgi:hypothetical protein